MRNRLLYNSTQSVGGRRWTVRASKCSSPTLKKSSPDASPDRTPYCRNGRRNPTMSDTELSVRASMSSVYREHIGARHITNHRSLARPRLTQRPRRRTRADTRARAHVISSSPFGHDGPKPRRPPPTRPTRPAKRMPHPGRAPPALIAPRVDPRSPQAPAQPLGCALPPVDCRQRAGARHRSPSRPLPPSPVCAAPAPRGRRCGDGLSPAS